ncbi:hypothetical protein D3C85_1900690 [compost metagenome]
MSNIPPASTRVAVTSMRCCGMTNMTPRAKTMKTMTAQVSQGNSHILKSIRALCFSSRDRMRSWEKAITR